MQAGFGRRRTSDQYDVKGRQELAVESAHRFPNSPLDAVPHDRIPHAATDHYSDPCHSGLVLWADVTHEERVRPTPPVGPHPFKVTLTPQPMLTTH